jgi:phospholipase/carboxylesterase
MRGLRGSAALAMAAALAGATAGGCAADERRSVGAAAPDTDAQAASAGRLQPLARAREPQGRLGRPGLHELSTGDGRRALLRVPEAAGRQRIPFVLVLHGAGGDADSGLRVLGEEADAAGVAVLAAPSAERTWDVLLGGFGPDVAAIDGLLQRVSRSLPLDRERTAVAGFSDGASYALSLGLTNGDRFARVIAFSPGFAAPGERRARPPVYISHGTQDRVLPIDRTSRQLVPDLRRAGYAVRYREFSGGHTVPPSIAREALGLLVE